MNSAPIKRNHRILVVDDNRSIHGDFRKILCGSPRTDDAIAKGKELFFGEGPVAPPPAAFIVDSAYQGAEGLLKVRQALAADQPYAVAFVDIRMPPGWDGIETIVRLWQEQPDLQVVICTAYSDYSWSDMIRKVGISDSLVVLKKPFDTIEVLQLAYALCEKWTLNQRLRAQLWGLDAEVARRTAQLQEANTRLKREVEERRQVEQALAVSEERFAKAFEANPIPLALQAYPTGVFTAANHGFELLSGFTREELTGHTVNELQLDADLVEGSLLAQLQANPPVRNRPARLRHKSGALHDILISVELIQIEREPCLLVIALDVTEQLQLERQLRHSQKMEAVGELAAGIAHDFNNMLTVIQGSASLVVDNLDPKGSDYELLQAVISAAERSAKLVNQLLTFSRKQTLEVRSMEVTQLLHAVEGLLPRVLGEQVRVRTVPPATRVAIAADAGMMEQMLMNLAINARDAMPTGGELTIAATAVDVTPAMVQQNREARAGSFLRLSVSDTGCGIPPDVLPRIFEPFFTTKPVGQGTGLGLATVYGIVRQHEGWIDVQSEPGQGTTFHVFIPTEAAATAVAPPPAPIAPRARGTETILVVEDELSVREFVVHVLRSRGYTVLPAGNGSEALEQWARHEPNIDLLLTDMVMPGGITGQQLAATLLQQRPSLKVIFTSGYNPQTAGSAVASDPSYLAKPYEVSALLQTLRARLDQPASG